MQKPEYRYRRFNPLTAKLFSFNFYTLEIVFRWCDPQLQVSENYSEIIDIESMDC